MEKRTSSAKNGIIISMAVFHDFSQLSATETFLVIYLPVGVKTDWAKCVSFYEQYFGFSWVFRFDFFPVIEQIILRLKKRIGTSSFIMVLWIFIEKISGENIFLIRTKISNQAVCLLVQLLLRRHSVVVIRMDT